MENKIEVYLYINNPKGLPFFAGKGKFNAMPRIGETIFPINDKYAGKVTKISNWNSDNKLTWTGITTIYIDKIEDGENQDHFEGK